MRECPQCGSRAKIELCPGPNCEYIPKCTQVMCPNHLIITGDTEAKAVELWNNYGDPDKELTSIGGRKCPEPA